MKQIVKFNMTWSTGGNQLCNASERQLFHDKSRGKEAQHWGFVAVLNCEYFA